MPSYSLDAAGCSDEYDTDDEGASVRGLKSEDANGKTAFGGKKQSDIVAINARRGNSAPDNEAGKRPVRSSRRKKKAVSYKEKEEDDIIELSPPTAKCSTKNDKSKKLPPGIGASPNKVENTETDIDKNNTATPTLKVKARATSSKKKRKAPLAKAPENAESDIDKRNAATPTLKAKARATSSRKKRNPLARALEEHERSNADDGMRVLESFSGVSDIAAEAGSPASPETDWHELLANPFEKRGRPFSDVLLSERESDGVLDNVKGEATAFGLGQCDKACAKLSTSPSEAGEASPNDEVAIASEKPEGTTATEKSSNEESNQPFEDEGHKSSKRISDCPSKIEEPPFPNDEVTVMSKKPDGYLNGKDSAGDQGKLSTSPSEVGEASPNDEVAIASEKPQGTTATEKSSNEESKQPFEDEGRKSSRRISDCPSKIGEPPLPNDEVAIVSKKPDGYSNGKDSAGDQGSVVRAKCQVEGSIGGKESDKEKKVPFEADNTSSELAILCEDLSGMNLKSIAVKESAKGGDSKNPQGPSFLDKFGKDSKAKLTETSKKSARTKMQMLLDMSYLKSGVGVKHAGTAFPCNIHRRRVMMMLDNPMRAEDIVSMCLRNDKDMDLPELMRQFDYFSV